MGGLTAILAPSHPAVNFNTQFSDRSGSRILFLTDTPFLPASWLDLGHFIPGSKIPSRIFNRLPQPISKTANITKHPAKTAPTQSAHISMKSVIGNTTPQTFTMPTAPSSIAGHAGQRIVPGGVKLLPIPCLTNPCCDSK